MIQVFMTITLQREFQKREITLQNLDDEICRLNNYSNALEGHISSLSKQKNDLTLTVNEEIAKVIKLVTK